MASKLKLVWVAAVAVLLTGLGFYVYTTVSTTSETHSDGSVDNTLDHPNDLGVYDDYLMAGLLVEATEENLEKPYRIRMSLDGGATVEYGTENRTVTEFPNGELALTNRSGSFHIYRNGSSIRKPRGIRTPSLGKLERILESFRFSHNADNDNDVDDLHLHSSEPHEDELARVFGRDIHDAELSVHIRDGYIENVSLTGSLNYTFELTPNIDPSQKHRIYNK